MECEGPELGHGDQPGLYMGHGGPGWGSWSPLSSESAPTRGGPRGGTRPPRWLVAAGGFRLARNKAVPRTGREGRELVLGGAAKDCVRSWGLLSRKALPSRCSWIGGLTIICCVSPVGPACPPITFATVLLECSDLAWLCVAKGEEELSAQLRAH